MNTSARDWLPRPTLGWLLAAQLGLLLPHVQRLPVWVWGVFLVAAVWRLQVHRGRAAFPGRLLTGVLVLVAFVGTGVSYGTLLGLEATTALLFIAASLKLIEARGHRDAHVLVYLGFFLLMTAFLFEQEPWLALYAFLPLLLLAAVLLSLHQRGIAPRQTLARAGVLLLQALPVMLLLFLVVPRFAPMWSVPQQSQAAQTGMSDVMSPGDIASLSGSDRLAFRARFAAETPSRDQLYWRGLVFSVFDGRSWRPLDESLEGLLPAAPGGNELAALPRPPLDYKLMMEPSQQRWLFPLDAPVTVDADAVLTGDLRLVARTPVRERRLYAVRSSPDLAALRSLGDAERRINLALPRDGNPRARALAEDWRAQWPEPHERVAAALRLFREEAFYYTLNPPLLGEHSVDEFLFGSRRGFCEHYAGSFAFLMRAAGVPTRVIAGYQGGEINPLTGTVLVHDYDAHAWTEVWLEGEGWVRVDPTAAVAPQRILDSLQAALQEPFQPGGALSPARYRHIDWVNRMRLQLDAFQDYWTRWVLAYRGEQQWQLLERLLGAVTPGRLAALLLSGLALVLGVAWWWLMAGTRRPPADPALRLYRRFERRLERCGYPRPPAMAAGDYADWLLRQRPEWSSAVTAITRSFDRLAYEAMTATAREQELARLRQQLRRFRPTRRTRC